MRATDPCPCGRAAGGQPLAYADCCGRYLDHFATVPAPEAEALMRSRYTAFVRERADYLRATWHASARPAQLDFEAGARWLGLELRGARAIDAGHAEVEFVARVRGADGRAARLHERSLFVREADGALLRWYYLRALD